MGLRIKQTLWIERMRKEHPCFQKFIKVPSSPKSKESYAYKIQRFMKFAAKFKYVKHEEDFESLLDYDSEKITDILEEFVNYLESQGLVYEAIKPTLAAPELFFEMNRKLWHKKLVRRSMQKEDRIQGGRAPATTEDIQNMLKYCERSLRKQSIIHFLASTGIRPAALIDPVLKIKHLVSLPNLNDPTNQPHYCYAVKVYDESKEGYWAFITPEGRKTIDRYLNGRKLQGEKLDSESPLFSTLGSRWNTKNQYLTDDNMTEILEKIIKGSKIVRKKIGNRYDKSLTYMFRKRFNTILKLNNAVNSNIAEKLMAHKKGLDGTYLQPSMEDCYKEFFKAISSLTISDEERLRYENQQKQKELDNVQKNTMQIEEVKKMFQKEIDDLKYGPSARVSRYAKALWKEDITEERRIFAKAIAMLFEFALPEEKKRTMMRELELATIENRKPDLHAVFGTQKLTEEQKNQLQEYIKDCKATTIATKTNKLMPRFRIENLEMLLAE